jgi:Dolichyl-phosphate-mannose-protein mannosyltransferase
MDLMNLMVSSDSAISSAEIAPRRWTRRSTWLLGCVLVLSTVVITRGIRKGEFSYNVDETQHAVTGLFAADLMHDHPLTHPVQYTYEYYAQYPALGGVIHWPPLFYVFEGLSFLLLGPTVLAARVTVLAFALLGLTFWFLLVWELQNEWMAAAASLLLACLPAVLIFEKAVMLEIPCLALSLAATYFWVRYLLRQSASDVYWFAILAGAALLTKQNAVYLIPFCALSGLTMRGWRVFLKLPVLRAVSLCAVLVAPYYSLVYALHWKTIAMDLTEKAGSSGQKVAFYWHALPSQLGWTLLLLAILGIATSPWWERPAISALLLSWMAACYGTFTLIGHKEPRYVLYWVPPFVYFALGPLFCYFRKPLLRTTAAIAAALLLSSSLASAWTFHRPYVSGYAAAAKCVTAASNSGIILFDGPLPGDFIFFVRANDTQRRFLVLRKALYATRLKESGGSAELLHSPQEIEQLIRADGVRFIVISEGTQSHFESQEMLRNLLANPVFRPLGRFKIEGTDVRAHDLNLLVYENTAWAPPTEKFLRIRMLTLDHDIVVPFDRFRSQDETDPNAIGRSGVKPQ